MGIQAMLPYTKHSSLLTLSFSFLSSYINLFLMESSSQYRDYLRQCREICSGGTAKHWCSAFVAHMALYIRKAVAVTRVPRQQTSVR